MKATQQGFTLVEVMIALAIFAVFITAYVASQGTNLAQSARFRQALELHQHTQNKVNELIASPPELVETLEMTPETGTIENHDRFSYAITYKRFTIPDLNKIQGNPETAQEGEMAQLEQRLFTTVKENMERLLWQAEVTVTDKESNESYSLTTWLYNREAQVQFNGF